MARKTDIRFRRSATQGAIPTTSQLNLGELALNTYDGKLYMKKNVGGSESIVEVGAGSTGLTSSFTLYEYTASANQTTFSGADNNTNTLAYDTTSTPPKILVYLNGILLDHTTDYTATNGTSVVLVNAAASGDLLQVGAYKSTATVTSISLEDNQKIHFGVANDLSIYHDGSNSIIENDIAGDLFIKQKVDDKDIIFQSDDGSGGLSTYFFLDGSNAKTQFNRHLKIIDNIELQIGTGGGDLVLEHDGTDSYIKNSTGDLIIDCATDLTLDVDGGDIRLKDNGVQFGRFANFLGSLVITSGASDTAIIIGDANGNQIVGGDISLTDNKKLKLGAGNDLQLYHDTTHSYIDNLTGDLFIRERADDGDIYLQTDDGSGGETTYLKADGSNGTLQLMHYGSLKLSTTSSGVSVTGTITSDGLSVGSDTNVISTLGRAKIGAFVNDYAYFSHIDNATSSNYALNQNSTGATSVNAKAGTSLGLKINNANALTVASDSNVGIGTTSPSGKLHVYDSGTDTYGTQPIAIFDYYDTDDTALRYSARIGDGSTTFKTFVTNSAPDFLIQDQDNQAGRLAFQVTGNAGSNQILAAESTGKVGIGTITPNVPLEIHGADIATSATTTTASVLRLVRDVVDPSHSLRKDSAAEFRLSRQQAVANNLPYTRLDIRLAGVTDSSTPSLDVMSLMYDGNVGIGTTSPSEKLDVAGKIKTGGQIRSGSYLEAFPSFSFVNDTDTGMFSDTADQLEFSTGGTSRMTIDSSGNVTMGQNLTITGNLTVDGTTTTINTATLDVEDLNITIAKGVTTSTGANGAGITIEGPTNNASMTWDHANQYLEFNKDIFSNAHIIGTTGTKVGRIINASGVFNVEAYGTRQISFGNVDNGEHVRINADGNVGIGSSNPDKLLVVQGADAEIAISDTNSTPLLRFRENGTSAATVRTDSGKLIFTTRPSGGSLTDVGAFDTNGNLGIGTTSMTYPLEVHGNTTSSHRVRIINADNGQSSVDLKTSQQETRLIANSGNAFYVYNQSASFQPFTIKSNHNVGIGVTDPATRLEVKHDSNASTGITVENTSTGTGARAMVEFKSDAAQLNVYATGSNYSGVSSWADAGVLSTSSNSSGGLILNAQAGGIKFQDGTAERMRMVDGGQIAINATAARTTGGTARLTIADSTVQMSMGPSNSDNMYIRRMGGGLFQMQTYNSANTGHIELEPYGGQVGINTGGTAPGAALHIGSAGHLLFDRGGEVRSKDTSGNIKTIARVDSSNRLQYGWSGSGGVLFMGGGSYTERMRIHTNGNIGIGTTTPSQLLDVGGTTTSNNYILRANGSAPTADAAIFRAADNTLAFSTASTERMRIDSAGRVGIGTAPSSATTFHVQGNNSAIFRVDAQDGGSSPAMTARMQLYGYEGRGAGIKIRDNVNSASGATDREWFVGSGYNQSGFNIGYASDGSQSEYAAQNKLTIKTDGKVGIGTSGPSYPLEVQGAGTITFAYQRTGVSGPKKWGFHSDSSNTYWQNITDNVFGLTVSNAGKIGIGTISPDTNLDVTAAGVEGLIMNQDTGNASVSARMFFKDQTRTNGFLNVNGVLEARTGMVIGSTSGTKIIGVGPTQVEITRPLIIEEYQIDTTETSTTATTQVAIHSFAAATFRSARFTVQVTNSTDSTYHTTEILMVHDGTTANITEFAEIFTGSAVEAQFDCDINSGNVRLLATPSSTDAMEFKVIAHSITV